MSDAPFRAGFAAILGPPNAGKSTLLNRLLGEKLAIVTAKPQTTRSRILGIHTLDEAQIVFVDTPGLHRSEKLLNTVLNEAVEETARKSELALLLVDRSRGWSDAHDAIAETLRQAGTPAMLVGTKLDLARAFIDMGDTEGARGSLEEVMAEGNEEQKAEAKALLDQI